MAIAGREKPPGETGALVAPSPARARRVASFRAGPKVPAGLHRVVASVDCMNLVALAGGLVDRAAT